MTPEEVEFLKQVRFKNNHWPNALYYYRELQNLRNPLHFRRKWLMPAYRQETAWMVVRGTDL